MIIFEAHVFWFLERMTTQSEFPRYVSTQFTQPEFLLLILSDNNDNNDINHNADEIPLHSIH